MDLVDRWRGLLARTDAELPLDEAALVIAAHGSPGLDIALQLRRLDGLAGEVPGDDVDAVCAHLFLTLGLVGDSATYDDPRNSFLDQVLDRRRGIPITLSVLLIEVARRRDLSLEGVGMPGHFLVRDPAEPDQFIDAFGRGRRLGLHQCAELLRASTGTSMDLDPAMLAPIGRKVILARMLANLDQSYQHRSDRRSLVWVRRLRVLNPVLPLKMRVELAGGLAELGAFDVAEALLSELADLAGAPGADPAVAESIRTRAVQVRARLN